MSRLRFLAVLETASNKPPLSQAPNPARTLNVRAAEDTDLLVELVDDGFSPVQHAAGQAMTLTVRPTPSVEDERVFHLSGVPAPLEGPNLWRFTFSAGETRRRSTDFQRGFYAVLFTEASGSKSLVIPASPFHLISSVSR